MQCFLLMKPTPLAEKWSIALGSDEVLFFDEDFVLIRGENRKKVLNEIHRAKNKIKIFYAQSGEMLRFVLEKTSIDFVTGLESIYKKDSLHYPRSGLDQVLCKIAAERNKTVLFSFDDLLNCQDEHSKYRLLWRMAFNLRLCHKFKVNTSFANFSRDLNHLRSASDLAVFRRVLEQLDRNIYK